MATTSTENLTIAYFQNHEDAENALRDLQKAGFRSDQIGSSYEDYDTDEDYGTDEEYTRVSGEADHRSFWQKIRDFFSGESFSDREQRGTEETSWYNGGYAVPERYRSRLSEGGGLISVRADNRAAEAEQILTRNNGQIDREFATEWQQQVGAPATSAAAGTERETPERRIQLISEVLRVHKERVTRGEVRLRKEIRTETQNLQVPVTREEIVIERTPVSEQRPSSAPIGTDQEIRVPLTEEQVRVEKVPVVQEEVRVGKKPVSETQKISDQVRREELQVEGDKERDREERDKRKTA